MSLPPPGVTAMSRRKPSSSTSATTCELSGDQAETSVLPAPVRAPT